MTPFDTQLFPLPHVVAKDKRNGSLLPWPSICRSCHYNTCLNAKIDSIDICPHGYNYTKTQSNIIIGGILLSDHPTTSSSRTKRLKRERSDAIPTKMLLYAIKSLENFDSRVCAQIVEEKRGIIEDYIKKQQFRVDFLQELKPEIQKGLSFVHDYKQINTQIIQNINIIIEKKYSGPSLDEKLKLATQQEKAIYEASKFLNEKLNVAKFLMNPEWLDAQSECTQSRFHGVLLKYLRIYTPRFESKNINVSLQGESYGEILANPQAISIIPHTFLDNAVKYSPTNSTIEIFIEDSDNGIHFSVSSFGPRILPQEQDKIFGPFFRAKSAKRTEQEGAGYGLYISQLVAERHLGTKITVEQQEQQTRHQGHWTTFSTLLPFQAKVIKT